MPKPPSRTAPRARLAESALAERADLTEPWPGRKLDLAGTRVHVRSTPPLSDDAEPALFVHGLGGSALNWTDVAGALRHRLAIDAIDLAGHGLSGPSPDNRYTPQTHADTVIAYIERAGRGPVHLVGNSMGGAVSIVVAAQRPDLVRTLTLISPAVPDKRPRLYALKANPRFALVVVPVLGEFLTKQFNARIAPEVRAKGTIAICFADRKRFSEQRMAELVDELRQRSQSTWTDKAVLRSLRGLVNSQLLKGRSGWRTMAGIGAPTLVIWGDTDRLVAPDLAPYVAAAIPDSRLLVMDDIGHTAMMEAPEPVARAIIGLLEDTAAADAA